MPRPTDSPLFATDASFAVDGDAWGGADVRTDPGAGRRAEGFEPDVLPAEWLNHVLGVHGDWIDWVDNSIDASGLVLEGIQTVTKRSAALDFALVGASTGGIDSSAQAFKLTSNSGGAVLDVSRMLHKGGEFKQVRVLVDPGALRAGANRMSVLVFRRSISGSTVTNTQLGSTTPDDGLTADPQWITVAFTPEVVGNNMYYVAVNAGNDASVNNDLILAVETTQDCLTVRND